MRQCDQCQEKHDPNITFFKMNFFISRHINEGMLGHSNNESIELCSPDCVTKFVTKITNGIISRKDN